MNTEKSLPLPVPMVKEATVKDDGRFLFYYTFPAADPHPAHAEDLDKTMMEDPDV